MLNYFKGELIGVVAAAARKSVVVATVPGAILTNWKKDVNAVLVNFLPGQEIGNAAADGLTVVTPTYTCVYSFVVCE